MHVATGPVVRCFTFLFLSGSLSPPPVPIRGVFLPHTHARTHRYPFANIFLRQACAFHDGRIHQMGGKLLKNQVATDRQ